MIKILFPISILVLIILTLFSIPKHNDNRFEHAEFMNGVSFVAPPEKFTSNPFGPVKAVNADWVAIMPYAFGRKGSPDIQFENERQWWGEKKSGTIHSIAYAKEMGLKVFLKPHVWFRGMGWSGDFTLGNDREWEIWESNYSRYILSFAKIADSMKVEAFCVGLEFKKVVRERPDYFPALIKQVRNIYQGKITYAANWDNYLNIRFWDQVDFIGINAYFPLSQEATPGVNALNSAWKKEKASLAELSREYHKAIVFTEFGYRSVDAAVGNQWELEHHRNYDGPSNFEAQSNGYLSLFHSIWQEPWFRGGFLWKWYSEQHHQLDPNNSDYTPQKKPVEKIIREWYKKS